MVKEFKLTDEELKNLKDACKPVPYMIIGGCPPPSAQENANDAWKRLGNKYGFIWDTVRPIAGKDVSYFNAEVK